MYKNKTELVKITLVEIAEYVAKTEATEHDTEDFMDWCENDLLDAMEEMGISDNDLDTALRIAKSEL